MWVSEWVVGTGKEFVALFCGEDVKKEKKDKNAAIVGSFTEENESGSRHAPALVPAGPSFPCTAPQSTAVTYLTNLTLSNMLIQSYLT